MKCGKNEYYRKPHDRQSISGEITHVDGTCVKYKFSQNPKKNYLPKPDDKLHLRTYGYRVAESEKDRRIALREAVLDNDIDVVLHRLILEMNIQKTGSANKLIMKNDVEYLKRARNKLINKGYVSKSSWKTKYEDRTQQGGIDDFVEYYRICDSNDCRVALNIYEAHNVDGKDVVFRTLSVTDAEKLSLLNNMIYDDALSLLKLYEHLNIGVFVDTKLVGFVTFKEVSRNTIKLDHFYCLKGIRSTLLLMLGRVFSSEEYKTIIIENTNTNDLIEWLKEKNQYEVFNTENNIDNILKLF
jgi:hypothetical protein